MFSKRHLRLCTSDATANPDQDLNANFADCGFAVKQDDFSLQVYCHRDRLFWIRIDQDASGLEITDLNPGDLTSGEVVVALRWALRLAGHEAARLMIIRDIAPSGDAAPRLASLRTILAELATKMDYSVVNLQVSVERKKVNLVAEFTP